MPKLHWEFSLRFSEQASEQLQNVSSVLKLIFEHSPSEWPEDDYWVAILPDGIRSYLITSERADELMAQTPRKYWGDLPWEFGSWLEAMKERRWEWKGMAQHGRTGRAVVEMVDLPPRIDALRQIFLAAGVEIVGEREA